MVSAKSGKDNRAVTNTVALDGYCHAPRIGAKTITDFSGFDMNKIDEVAIVLLFFTMHDDGFRAPQNRADEPAIICLEEVSKSGGRTGG